MENADKTNPFEFSYKEFSDLSDIERDDIFKIAHNQEREFINKFFEKNPKIEWIVIAHKKENIINQGEYGSMPTSTELDKLAEKEGVPVFCYSGPDGSDPETIGNDF